MLRTRENSDVFNSLDEIYLVFTSKKQISSIYYYIYLFIFVCVCGGRGGGDICFITIPKKKKKKKKKTKRGCRYRTGSKGVHTLAIIATEKYTSSRSGVTSHEF